MKEIVKEHPLRPIILQFDLKKKALDFEIQALEAYYRMHDRSWETKQQLLQHKAAFSEIEATGAELECRLLPIKQQLDFLEAAFGLAEDVELPVIAERFSIVIADFYGAVDSFSDDQTELHGRLVDELKWFNDWADYIYENETWFDQQDDEGNDLIHQVFRHYDDVSVDIISLDRDQQEFFGAVADITKLQQAYFDQGTTVHEEYTRLHHEAEEVYRRAKRVKAYVDEHY